MANEYDPDENEDDDRDYTDDCASGNGDNNSGDLTETQQAIADSLRAALLEGTDINAAMAHRFEYHIFHAGDVHRIGRVTHEDIYPLIGEWVGKRIRKGNGTGMQLLAKPLHVFMDGNLWTVLNLKSIVRGSARFSETSIMFGLVHEAEVLNDLRVLTWNPDEEGD